MLRTYCQSQEKPHQKKPCSSLSAVLSARPLLGLSLRVGPGRTSCSRTWPHCGPFQSQFENQSFLWQGERISSGGMLRACPSPDRVPPNAQGLLPLILTFYNATLGHIFCDRHSSKAFLKSGRETRTRRDFSLSSNLH